MYNNVTVAVMDAKVNTGRSRRLASSQASGGAIMATENMTRPRSTPSASPKCWGWMAIVAMRATLASTYKTYALVLPVRLGKRMPLP